MQYIQHPERGESTKGDIHKGDLRYGTCRGIHVPACRSCGDHRSDLNLMHFKIVLMLILS